MAQAAGTPAAGPADSAAAGWAGRAGGDGLVDADALALRGGHNPGVVTPLLV
ncbi:hypothetical protein ACFWAR_00830 [Streptomyces sp. NPDC059917]|uniref:hypothetical protein n=1 Tax=Streptomyces sp. NPDC059917 TaxID=3347002 RepID=UPI00364D96FE